MSFFPFLRQRSQQQVDTWLSRFLIFISRRDLICSSFNPRDNCHLTDGTGLRANHHSFFLQKKNINTFKHSGFWFEKNIRSYSVEIGKTGDTIFFRNRQKWKYVAPNTSKIQTHFKKLSERANTKCRIYPIEILFLRKRLPKKKEIPFGFKKRCTSFLLLLCLLFRNKQLVQNDLCKSLQYWLTLFVSCFVFHFVI